MGMLDKKHNGYFETVRGDDYIYIGGELNGHKIVVATWPAGQNYGPGAAAALVNQVKARFSNIPSVPHKIPSLHPAYYSAHSTSSSVMMRHNNNPMTRSLFPYSLHLRPQPSKRVLKPRIMLRIRLASSLSCVAGSWCRIRSQPTPKRTPQNRTIISQPTYISTLLFQHSQIRDIALNSLKITSFLQSLDLRVASSAHCSR